MNGCVKKEASKEEIHSVFSSSTCINSFTFIYLFPLAIIIIIIIYEQKDSTMTETKAWHNHFHTHTQVRVSKLWKKIYEQPEQTKNMKAINVLNDMKIHI